MSTNENPGGHRGPQDGAVVNPNLSDVPVLPQHFPLYAVTGVGTLTLVLGWSDGAPMLQPIGRDITGAPHRYTAVYQLHTDYDEAVSWSQAVTRNRAARKRHAEQGGLPDGLDPFWSKWSASARARMDAVKEPGKPLTEAQWAEVFKVQEEATA